MKSIGDLVREHADEKPGSTGQGIDFLELDHAPENFCAGNLYIAALDIINSLKLRAENAEARLAEAEKVIAPFAKRYDTEFVFIVDGMATVDFILLRAASEWMKGAK